MARYRLFIGNKRFSSWSLRPWLAMKMAGIPFEERIIALRSPETSADIARHSPSGKVPVLTIEENGATRTVWDSLAICETMAEAHPEAELWPTDAQERAQARSIAAEMHAGFPSLRKTLSMDIGARHPTPVIDEALAAEIDRIAAIWSRPRNGEFLFGRFSIADAFYAPVATRFVTYSVTLPTRARAYVDTIMGLAPMKEWERAAREDGVPR
jgi:glutathione S-transferase